MIATDLRKLSSDSDYWHCIILFVQQGYVCSGNQSKNAQIGLIFRIPKQANVAIAPALATQRETPVKLFISDGYKLISWNVSVCFIGIVHVEELMTQSPALKCGLHYHAANGCL